MKTNQLILCMVAAVLTACGGGGGSSTPPPTKYSLSGTITGLIRGGSLPLLNNGTNNGSLSANGSFLVLTAVSGTAYNVTIGTAPSGQSCSINNGSGTLGTSDVSNISITCTTPGNLATSVPPATYTSGSNELQAFTALQAARSAAGVGLLTQVSTLDQAGVNHANYILANGYTSAAGLNENLPAFFDGTAYSLHNEVSGYPNFTGTTLDSRQVATGYLWGAGEVIDFPGAPLGNEFGIPPGGQLCIVALLDTVFHRALMLDPAVRDIGVGYRISSDGLQAVCDVELGASDTITVTPDGFLSVFPVAGSTVTSVGIAEFPDPVPTASWKAYPVSILVGVNHGLGVTSFTLADANGNNIPGVVLTQTNGGSGFLRENTAYFVPTQKYTSGMTYTATFVGTDNGVLINKTWSYKAQ